MESSKNTNLLKVHSVGPKELIPSKATRWSASYDFVAAEEKLLQPGESAWVSTGVKIALPHSYCGILMGRPSNTELGLRVDNCLLDSEPTDVIQVRVTNCTEKVIEIQRLARIAQLVLLQPASVPVFHTDDVAATKRVFGTTGNLIV